MSLIRKITDGVKRLDDLYSMVFIYIFDVTDDGKYSRMKALCFELNKIEFTSLINQTRYESNINITQLLDDLIVIHDRYKDLYQKYLKYKEEVLKTERNDPNIPFHDTFIYDFIEGHFNEFESSISNLKERIGTKYNSNNKKIDILLNQAQLDNLYIGLKGRYIAESTLKKDFNDIFNIDNWHNNNKIKSIPWILTSTKNNQVTNKKALMELFMLLKSNNLFVYSTDAVLFKFIRKNIVDKSGNPIILSAANKPKDYNYSEARLELENIVQTL